MIRLGFWIVLGALAIMAVTFLPAVLGDSNDLAFVADALLCDGDHAILTANLSQSALAKGNLGSVISGVCADSSGRRLGPIPPSLIADRLVLMIGVGLAGILMIGFGVFRRAGRSSITTAALPTTTPGSVSAAKVRQRDAEDVAARNQANYMRAQAPVSAPKIHAAVTTPDWMLGMPAADMAPAQPAQPFDFAEPNPAASDLKIQLNLLQLAYESSLIPRSEYDARRAALLGRSVSAGQR